MSKYIKNSLGELCPKCGAPMERREHKNITFKELNRPYYFSEWDYCRDCKHTQLYEKYKIINDPERANELKRQRQEWKERQQQLDFFKSI